MLDDQTIALVQATVPALEAHGLAIVKRMYTLMFAERSDVQKMFNPANQTTERQHGALAGAVLAYAANVHDPSVLSEAIALIVHKHVAHRVKPAHYPVVGKHLLQAIQDVLGEAATPEIVEAWGKAYGFLADVLIGAERQLESEQVAASGGWANYRSFVVQERIEESSEIVSLVLKPEDAKAVSRFLPGQYLPLKIKTSNFPDGTVRTYSLSQRAGLSTYRITVKAEAGGDVSNHVHQNVKVGDVLEASMPCGSFYLAEESSDPVLLLSGGVGQTPLFSMLDSIVNEQPKRAVYFAHGARDGAVHALGQEVAACVKLGASVQSKVWFSEPRPEDQVGQNFDEAGFISEQDVKGMLETLGEAQVYICGPRPFLVSMLKHLKQLDVPESRIHFEFFGPATALA